MRRAFVIITDGLILWVGAALFAVLYLGILWESGIGIDSLGRVEPIYYLEIALNLPRGGIVRWLRRYYRRARRAA